MLNDDKNQLMIFCDGGIGNRINSLISGLAIARHFKLAFCVYWPENNWCQAGFEDIFKNQFALSKKSIKDLTGQLSEAVVLLHDEIASNKLEVEFNSAYQYASTEDFHEKVLKSGRQVFYYPALMPEWIPFESIKAELKTLIFTDHIVDTVNKFVVETIKKPFHGLHLRRTDLNVGLNDHEVINLVQRNPNETFFVCSDDPVAEAIASAHPNVFARPKSHHVGKKNGDAEWLASSEDDDGRIYYGNINRGKEAVIEGAIDMLILAHSQIVGYSGSTFQRIAKIIGENAPLLKIGKPSDLNYFGIAETLKQLKLGLLSAHDLILICNRIAIQGDMNSAIEILHSAINYYEKSDLEGLLHTLGIFSLNQNNPKLAIIYFKYITSENSNRFSTLLHLSYAYHLIEDHEARLSFLNLANNCKPVELSSNDYLILDFLQKQN
jgi:hypothetical protein